MFIEGLSRAPILGVFDDVLFVGMQHEHATTGLDTQSTYHPIEPTILEFLPLRLGYDLGMGFAHPKPVLQCNAFAVDDQESRPVNLVVVPCGFELRQSFPAPN